MIKIICTSCQKPLSLDETKLPMKDVSCPCAACKTRVGVDRRNREGGATTADVPAVVPEPHGHHDEEPDGFGARALLVGTDHPGIRQAAKLIGYVPVHMATAAEAREYFSQEFPPVVMLNPAQITPPPLEAMGPIIPVTPQNRPKPSSVPFSTNLLTPVANPPFPY